MRFLDSTKERAVGTLAVAAAIFLIVRLVRKSQRRRAEHDAAVKTLRESGEFFLPTAEANPDNAANA